MKHIHILFFYAHLDIIIIINNTMNPLVLSDAVRQELDLLIAKHKNIVLQFEFRKKLLLEYCGLNNDFSSVVKRATVFRFIIGNAVIFDKLIIFANYK